MSEENLPVETDEAAQAELTENPAEAAEEEIASVEQTVEAEEAEAGEEEGDIDPLEKFRNEIMMIPGDWYVLHT